MHIPTRGLIGAKTKGRGGYALSRPATNQLTQIIMMTKDKIYEEHLQFEREATNITVRLAKLESEMRKCGLSKFADEIKDLTFNKYSNSVDSLLCWGWHFKNEIVILLNEMETK